MTSTATPAAFNGVNLAYDRSERDFPAFTVTNGVDLSDPTRLSHRSLARTQYNSRNLGYNFSVNARRELVHLRFKS